MNTSPSGLVDVLVQPSLDFVVGEERHVSRVSHCQEIPVPQNGPPRLKGDNRRGEAYKMQAFIPQPARLDIQHVHTAAALSHTTIPPVERQRASHTHARTRTHTYTHTLFAFLVTNFCSSIHFVNEQIPVKVLCGEEGEVGLSQFTTSKNKKNTFLLS